MPEIDTDLFQLTALVLLGLLVIVGLAMLTAIRKLRKALEATAEQARAWPGGTEGERFYQQAQDLSAGPAEMPDSAAAEPVAESGAAVPAAEPVADSRSDAAVAAEEPAPEVATPTPAAGLEREPEPAVESAQPVAAATTAESAGARTAAEPIAAGAGAGEPTAAAGASTEAAEEPEEQPFERGGRWWFRRGDELLVYDDATGQWQPAPAEAGPATSTQEVPTTLGDVGRAENESTAAPAGDAEAGAFWKCPSCGAVNGSTATSCRMCFTAKP